MISRAAKKKPASSPPKVNKDKKKTKSKSKQKQKRKSQKLSSKDFLQALIDLQNTNCSTNKKKRHTTRDISSALTVATPALQKTISASKIRSKSSFSQYRKKCTGSKQQPLTINLCAIITQQDNIQYTQKTARSQYQQDENKKNKLNVLQSPNKRLNENICATKIQKAWRNYQIYKMVHQIYLKQKKQSRKQVQKNEQKPQQIHIKIYKPDLQKTLRIKKQHAQRKQQRKTQQFHYTKKIINERYKIQQNKQKTPLLIPQNSPILGYSLHSSSSAQTEQHQQILLQTIKQKQTKMLDEVIKMIQNETQAKSKSKQQLINQLIKKCQNNKMVLQETINSQLCNSNKQDCLLEQYEHEQRQYNSSQKSSFRLKSQQFDRHVKQYSDVSSLHESTSSKSLFQFQYQIITEDVPEIKIFDQRLEMIKSQKIRKLQKIDQDMLNNRLQISSAGKKKQIIYNRYDKDKKDIQKNRKQFIFSLSKLKKIALDCQKLSIKHNTQTKKIKRSFSSGNTVLKQIISNMKIKDIESQQQIYEYVIDNPKQNIQQFSKILTNTPVVELPSPNKPDSQSQLLQKNNTETMKQYSQQVQQLIQKQLIQQFVNSIFLDEELYKYFKPYVQQIYQFRKVTDSQICSFFTQIQAYLPSQHIMLQRSNQKINPTSLQILRIIRDLQYQSDQYQLIIPQQCFKKYRNSVEKQYQQENKKRVVDSRQISRNYGEGEIGKRVMEIQLQKRQRQKKYRNFQRDLKIMYMKSVFNCLNQFLIQQKSSSAYMNSRSSIGPGQLSLSIKQYNKQYTAENLHCLYSEAQAHLHRIISIKCSIPSFKNYRDIEQFQREVMRQIKVDSNENQFKWVNYMDEVLEIWADLSNQIVGTLMEEVLNELQTIGVIQ